MNDCIRDYYKVEKRRLWVLNVNTCKIAHTSCRNVWQLIFSLLGKGKLCWIVRYRTVECAGADRVVALLQLARAVIFSKSTSALKNPGTLCR